MVHYKLHYFHFRGRGESIRQIFLAAGQEFEEVSYKYDTVVWPGQKKNFPLGQVPVLEVDGEQICQSLAIMRFLGNQFGMAGSTPMEKARLDMIADTVEEMRDVALPTKWGPVLREVIKVDSKHEYYMKHVKPSTDEYAPLIEKFLERNGSNGLFIGDKVTWVDVFACEAFSHRRDFGDAHALDEYPNIRKLIDRIHAIPSIKKHIQERLPTLI